MTGIGCDGLEWSRAVGWAKEVVRRQRQRDRDERCDFPVGIDYPPTKAKVGNYADTCVS